MCKAQNEEIAQEILAYLAQNPDAQDTLSGVIEWWLLDQRIRTRTAQVREVIDQLVADGLILARKGRDSQIHYRVNRRKHKHILAVVKEGSQKGGQSSQ
jgi:Fe2+ or Zn2+ uptake regulation protein